jgi:hypothetical protein
VTKAIDDLIELQRLDIRLKVLKDFLDGLPGGREALAAEKKAAEDEINGKRTELDKTKEQLRRAERHLTESEDKLRQTQAKLNMVKTNKEYDASLKEIEEWKKKIGEVEEEILLLYDKVEETEKARALLEKGWKIKAADFQARETALERKGKAAETEYGAKTSARSALAGMVSADDLRLYERVRAALGRALARADKEVCQGCWARMPAQTFNEVLKSDKIVRCQSCERIMVCTEAPLDEGLLEIGE